MRLPLSPTCLTLYPCTVQPGSHQPYVTIKVTKNKKFSSLVRLVTFQELISHLWLVVTILHYRDTSSQKVLLGGAILCPSLAFIFFSELFQHFVMHLLNYLCSTRVYALNSRIFFSRTLLNPQVSKAVPVTVLCSYLLNE